MVNEPERQEERAADCPLKINLDPVKRMVEETRTKILSSTLIRVDEDAEGRADASQAQQGSEPGQQPVP